MSSVWIKRCSFFAIVRIWREVHKQKLHRQLCGKRLSLTISTKWKSRVIFFLNLQVSPNRLEVKECSLDIITFTITPTIPVAASELQKDKYLKISFWSSDGIEIDSDDCEVRLKDLQPITVRVIARCTTTEQSPTVDKRIVPTIEGGHSPFWNRSSYLPSVAVSVLLIN